MKKFISLFALLFVLTAFISAQTPQFYNYNTTNGGNTFPFGTPTGRMVQFLILPGEINQPGPATSGNITKIYCMIAASFGPLTYTNLSILFGQSTITTLATGVFYTGDRDTVYKRASVSISGTLLNWLGFTLDHPFAYDSTKSLIIQIEQQSASGSALYSLGNTYLTGKRRTYSTPYPFGVQGQDAYVINFGVDITQITGVDPSINSQVPDEYKLEQNYPNPFNPVTKINFDLQKSGFVTLKIYDILGKEIATLVNGMKNAGSYFVDFDGSSLSSGMYFYRLETNEFVATKEMVLRK
ncbi:MAG: T9SS type A sorting domain-containing protein [Ignavibacteriae bacterium]|nr:T9SS type A sorting domain-containing protein [Ignavibacteriota bacterium]